MTALRVIRQEARHQLQGGKGHQGLLSPRSSRACSHPGRSPWRDRRDCLVGTGQVVPGYSRPAPTKARFFVHSPFAWRLNDHRSRAVTRTPVVLPGHLRRGAARRPTRPAQLGCRP